MTLSRTIVLTNTDGAERLASATARSALTGLPLA